MVETWRFYLVVLGTKEANQSYVYKQNAFRPKVNVTNNEMVLPSTPS